MNILLNALLYIQTLLRIKDKEGRLIRLILNPPQLRLYEAIKAQWKAGKPVRIIILKARQMGFSTLVVAIVFWLTATAKHVDSMIVAHKDEATANLFRMAKLFLASAPIQLPGYPHSTASAPQTVPQPEYRCPHPDRRAPE